jgi:ABC-2 type transport system permease protein
VSARRTLAVAVRVLRQMVRDRRTFLLIMVVPCALMALLWWIYRDVAGGTMFDRVGPSLLAIFPFTTMFLVASVTTLHERASGTLERLLAMPMGRLDFLVGYGAAFVVLSAAQSVLAVATSVGLLGLDFSGPLPVLVLIAIADAATGAALGLFVSAFAYTEFQAVQFMPAIVVPQVLLCGLLTSRDALPGFLHGVSNVLPLTYAVDAMKRISVSATSDDVWLDLLVVAVYALALLALGAATLRRRTP